MIRLKDWGVRPLDLRRPKGFGVTLTIKFGGDDLRFCWVAVAVAILKESGGVLRPNEG